MNLRDIDSNRLFFGILALFAALSALFVINVSMFGGTSEAADVYFKYADEVMNGRPLQMEYPPFALAVIMFPRLLTADPAVYEMLFAAEAYVFLAIGLLIVRKLASFYGKSQNKMMLVYAVLLIPMLEFIIDRHDIFPMVITLLSLYCFVTKRYFWALALLSVATMTKLYPAVLFPAYIIPFFVNRDWRNVIRIVGTFAILMGLLIAVPFVLGSGLITQFVGYHMARPLQIESVASSFIYLGSLFGITDVQIIVGFGSDNLRGILPDAVASYLTPLMAVCILLMYSVYTYFLVKVRGDGRGEGCGMVLLGCAALLSVLLFMLVGQVFSAQYVIWAVPFIIFLLIAPIGRTARIRLLVLSIMTMSLTVLNAFVNIGIYGGGANIEAPGMLIILVRNIIMLIMVYHVARIAWDCVKSPGLAQPSLS